MALTIVTGTANGATDMSYLRLMTGEGCGAHSAYGPLFFAGKGTSNVSTCLFFRTSEAKPSHTRPHDAQNAFTVAAARPA